MELEAEELRSLRLFFLDEARDYTSSIGDALAQLDHDGENVAALSAVLRKAHTLKGAAGAVVATRIAELAHQLEDEVLTYQRGDRASRSLSAMRKTSDTLGQELDALESRLELAVDDVLTRQAHRHKEIAASSFSDRRAEPSDLDLGDDVLSGLGAPELTEKELSERRRRQDRRLLERRREGDPFSVRVEVERLEELMDATSELVIVRTRFSRRLDELNDAITELSPLGVAHRTREAADDVRIAQVLTTLEHCAEQTRSDIEDLNRTFRTLNESIRRTKMMPVRRLFQRLQAAVTEWARRDGKLVRVTTDGDDSEVDKVLLERLVEPLVHLLRNAVAHGIEQPATRIERGKNEVGHIAVMARLSPQFLEIEVSDDGAGIDIDELRQQLIATGHAADLDTAAVLKFLFVGGLSTRSEVDALAGRGIGLATVNEAVEALDGEVRVETKREAGTSFTLRIPVATMVQEAFLFKVGGQVYGVPKSCIAEVVDVSPHDIIFGTPDQLRLPGKMLPLVRTGALLELSAPPFLRERRIALVLSHEGESFAITCDKIVGARQVVMRSLGALLLPLRLYDGATISGAGKVQLMLNVEELHHRAQKGVTTKRPLPYSAARRILLVDDSRTVRDTVSRMLERLGYVVESVVDGWDAWEVLQDRPFDLLITDLEMPGLDGYELIDKLRRLGDLRSLPIVVLTAQATESTRETALRTGANAFLSKPTNADALAKIVADMLSPRRS